MKRFFNPLVTLYIMQPLVKGFSVFYFVLLPVFYAQKIISSAAIGYIGGLFILLVVIGAVIVANWLHSMQTKLLLQLSAATAIFASFLLLFGAAGHNILFLLTSFGLMGLANGTSMSGVNAYAAQVTTRGDR